MRAFVNANAILKIAGQDYPLFDGDIVKVDLIKRLVMDSSLCLGNLPENLH